MLSDFDVRCKKCGNVSFVKMTEVGTFYCGECHALLFEQNYDFEKQDFVRIDIDENNKCAHQIYI
jgi:transcription initiation factor TFIIIB Brf1 subunit/transcription initiation factor TFIIB